METESVAEKPCRKVYEDTGLHEGWQVNLKFQPWPCQLSKSKPWRHNPSEDHTVPHSRAGKSFGPGFLQQREPGEEGAISFCLSSGTLYLTIAGQDRTPDQLLLSSYKYAIRPDSVGQSCLTLYMPRHVISQPCSRKAMKAHYYVAPMGSHMILARVAYALNGLSFMDSPCPIYHLCKRFQSVRLIEVGGRMFFIMSKTQGKPQ